MRIKNLNILKKSTPSTYKRPKTSSSAVYCATDGRGLRSRHNINDALTPTLSLIGLAPIRTHPDDEKTI